MSSIQEQATNIVFECDRVAIRCFKAGVAFPADWKAYNDAAVAVLAGTGTTMLPRPASYPAGS